MHAAPVSNIMCTKELSQPPLVMEVLPIAFSCFLKSLASLISEGRRAMLKGGCTVEDLMEEESPGVVGQQLV